MMNFVSSMCMAPLTWETVQRKEHTVLKSCPLLCITISTFHFQVVSDASGWVTLCGLTNLSELLLSDTVFLWTSRSLPIVCISALVPVHLAVLL